MPGVAGGGFFGVPDVVFADGDLLERAVGHYGVGFGFGNGFAVGGLLEVVVLLDEEPVGLLFGGGFAAHADECPIAFHLGAIHGDFERAGAEAFVYIGVAGLGFPGALVPKHDGASAVLACGDDAFEAAVLHGVIFHLDGEALVGGDVAGAFGACPTLEDAVPAEAEVVVQVGGGVFLDNEGVLLTADFWTGLCSTSGWLGGDGEVAHLAVAGELYVDCI